MSLVLDQMDLAGKVAIVKGSGRRLGKAMAIALADTGADLVVTVRRMEIEETAQEIEKKGNRTFSIQADIANPGQLDQLVRQTIERFGKLDILVNNADVAIVKAFQEMSLEKSGEGQSIPISQVFFFTVRP